MDINIKDLKTKTREELLFLSEEHALSETQLKSYNPFQEVKIDRVCIMEFISLINSLDTNRWMGWLYLLKNETLYCVSGINIEQGCSGRKFFISKEFAEQSYWSSYILIKKFYANELKAKIITIYNGKVIHD
jgi:hypothetical protein